MADAVSRFGWIGPTRRAALRERIAMPVLAWLADWRMAHDGIAPHVDDAPVVPYSPDEACVLQAGPGLPNLMVMAARDELVRLGNWLAGIHESPATLSSDVGRAALEDLAHRISHLGGQGDVREHGEIAWPRTLTREELGAVGLTFEVGGVTIGLALSRVAVDVLCPADFRAAGVALHPRGDAATAAVVSLTAGLDFGAISMRELGDLRVGEVLVGECSLDTPVRVLAPGGEEIGSARMGRLGRRLAITMKSSMQQGNP
ncbi:hypothetical protein [Fulvimonas yonginensis]|uniref:Flagellar motor switch protein FliN-like C-terminal domain-containing protein n=1 Tax=Fulvimonas yonginensis TaxID=1495200 RepID=A0ABU8JE42_9GAMM